MKDVLIGILIIVGMIGLICLFVFSKSASDEVHRKCQTFCAEKHSTAKYATIWTRDTCVCYLKDGSVKAEVLEEEE